MGNIQEVGWGRRERFSNTRNLWPVYKEELVLRKEREKSRGVGCIRRHETASALSWCYDWLVGICYKYEMINASIL